MEKSSHERGSVENAHQMSYHNYMKRKNVISTIGIGLLVILLFPACTAVRRIDVYEPVYLSYENLRKSIEIGEPRDISRTGKIYVKDSYLFINEYHEGVHVLDNSDPANPEIIAFIPIPGNVDIAVQGSILYADSYVDLVAIDISDPAASTEVDRIEEIFDYPYWSPWFDDVFSWDNYYEPVDEDMGVVVSWQKTATRIDLVNRYPSYREVLVDTGSGAGSGSGTGGSMARFTIVSDYLYALHSGYMQLFDISIPDGPAIWSKIQLDWNIETIFPYQDKLFIGSTTGMFIFDNSDPANPEKLSEFTHATACDPVVATETRAYVTLRSGTSCGGMSDQLDIIDITVLTAPEHIKSCSMQGPYGLGIDGSTLFLCDGVAGLKVYDVTDDEDIDLLAHFPDNETYDVIMIQGLALVIGPTGMRQYDYSDLSDIRLISTISVTSP